MRFGRSWPSCARRSTIRGPHPSRVAPTHRHQQTAPRGTHLLTIPGVGLLTATGLLAFIGDIRRSRSARHLASYLGLTPREYSSGLKAVSGRISKRGDGYLLELLIHGARSVLLRARTSQAGRPRTWAHMLRKTYVHNKVAVAVGKKMARIVWSPGPARSPISPLLRCRDRQGLGPMATARTPADHGGAFSSDSTFHALTSSGR